MKSLQGVPVMKRCKYSIVVLFSLLLVYCASAPEPVTEPELEVGTEREPEMEPEVVSREDLRLALDNAGAAIARAREADADLHDPANFGRARNALIEAQTMAERDPQRALEAANRAIEAADRAYDTARAEQREVELDDWFWRLQGLKVDLYAADEFATIERLLEQARAMLASGPLGEARSVVLDLIDRIERLYTRVDGQLMRTAELRATAERLLEQARAADAHLLAADRFRIAEERFQAGEEAMNRYDLDDAARNFQAAADAAAAAVETAGMQAPDATGELVDQLMQAVMKEIEAASHLTVVTDDGMGVEPKPWDGATVLGAGGKVPDAGMAEVSVAGLGGLDQAPQHLLLERAKELWRAGVARQAAEEYAAAVAYFEEARAYVMAFESLAVLAVYTVRLIPERRDSLWRIAEYDFIYGNPWLWPKIFHRNRKLIQDPDLIYPGWQLIIPPR